ncbi:hypothetical protein BRC70_07165 [Halobacteriales archaeon QH_6_68_27]|nr:MAG: hypothetical protein BRC70_07165 [Halobacteriales archaeon QH_6_68_27]
MSAFDEEAERERLREKYERDQEKRESTERMSELLLKGATMTNAHCETCGDPIFRYDGEEFCPTCQEVVTADESTDAESDAPSGGEADAETAGDAETPAEPGTDATPEPAPGTNGANAGATGPRPDAATAANFRDASTASGDAEGLAAARDSLTRTLLAQARAAERCEDPRQAETHLAAAREAAETLSALSTY